GWPKERAQQVGVAIKGPHPLPPAVLLPSEQQNQVPNARPRSRSSLSINKTRRTLAPPFVCFRTYRPVDCCKVLRGTTSPFAVLQFRQITEELLPCRLRQIDRRRQPQGSVLLVRRCPPQKPSAAMPGSAPPGATLPSTSP